MSFIRYMLAECHLGYVPKLGIAYRYASYGPFDIGLRATPKQLKHGYVLYEIVTPEGNTFETATTYGVFASMFREA